MGKINQDHLLAKERDIFRKNGGILRTAQAIKLGIHPRTLYAMREKGIIEVLSRGLFRLSELPPLDQPDLTTIASSIPRGVICLVSALSFYDLTTQIPHEVYVALNRGSEKPRIKYPPAKYFWFSGEAFSKGITTHPISKIPVKIYSPEKTIADCFKYRNKIGLDTSVEALRKWASRKKFNLKVLTEYAQILGVEKVMRPYLEAIL